MRDSGRVGRGLMRGILILSFLLITGGGVFSFSQPGQAAAWPEIQFQQIVTGVDRPVGIVHAGDGSGRLFLLEQAGRIRILQRYSLLETPFLDISLQVGCCGEQGLLGLAFPPGYAAKGHFYVNYTDKAGDTVIARYQRSANPNQADPGSEVVVLKIDQPFGNHNGGHIAFGPDGYLYIGLGDGGGGGDPARRAQNPADLLGKLLRINTEGPGCVTSQPQAQKNYCLPPDNPYLATPGYAPEVWAMGLRNPWRFSFDRYTGDLFTADVGQGRREEVNFQAASSPGGENYGWNILEGTMCYPEGTVSCTAPSGYSAPVAEYSHAEGGCSVTGGAVFRSQYFNPLNGIYFYADYCSGKVWGLRPGGGWDAALLADTSFTISSFGEDERGLLYLADLSGGAVYLLASPFDPTQFPVILFLPVVP